MTDVNARKLMGLGNQQPSRYPKGAEGSTTRVSLSRKVWI